jgi:hypothetical protein
VAKKLPSIGEIRQTDISLQQTLIHGKPTGPIQTNHNTPIAPPVTMAANPSPTVRP